MSASNTKSRFLSLYKQLSSRKSDTFFILALLTLETVLSIAIVKLVPYTEIDWEAYMQEVSMWQDGEVDYMKIRGGTGPLVYPAGFLYLYGALKWLTGGGSDILTGQYIFCMLYVINAGIVLSIYTSIGRELSERCGVLSMDQSHTIWSWRIAMIITCLSKRIHSIFVLRLFNDAPCMLLFYLSVLLFAKSKWRIGCIFFSLAVSIKMNVLLFAPGLLLLLLQSSESIIETIFCLSICAGIQLVLGAPFLLTYPISYIRKAFEFDRVFIFKWTVNWKFLPIDVFTSKLMSLLLLALHVIALCLFAVKWKQAAQKEVGNSAIFGGQKLNPIYVVHTLFLSNFIGIVFARTLHYQFFSWYFHSLPFMLWLTNVPIPLRLIIVLMVEYAFNIFPATPYSSAILQVAHGASLVALWKAPTPQVFYYSKQHNE